MLRVWGIFEWTFTFVLLFSLLGNLRSLVAFRKLRAAKEPVYLHQVLIVATDIAALLIAWSYFFIQYAGVPGYNYNTYKMLTSCLMVSILLTNRWVFLGTLLDRCEAMTDPIIYRSIDQRARVRKLAAAAVIGGTIVGFASLVNWGGSMLFLKKASLGHRADWLCWHGVHWGWSWQPLSSQFFAKNVQSLFQLTNYQLPNRIALALIALLGTDLLLGIHSRRLVRHLERYQAKRRKQRLGMGLDCYQGRFLGRERAMTIFAEGVGQGLSKLSGNHQNGTGGVPCRSLRSRWHYSKRLLKATTIQRRIVRLSSEQRGRLNKTKKEEEAEREAAEDAQRTRVILGQFVLVLVQFGAFCLMTFCWGSHSIHGLPCGRTDELLELVTVFQLGGNFVAFLALSSTFRAVFLPAWPRFNVVQPST